MMKELKTVNIYLASALLTEIVGVLFKKIDHQNKVENKSQFILDYPEDRENEVEELKAGFFSKQLAVNLYSYNRNLNFLRDQLFYKNGKTNDEGKEKGK